MFSLAASKAAHHGCMVVWSLSSTLTGHRRPSKTAVSIQPLIVLDWSDTDVEFIIPGARNGGYFVLVIFFLFIYCKYFRNVAVGKNAANNLILK